MGYKSTNKNEQTQTASTSIKAEEISILRAREINDNTVAFDMEVREVKIYGCFLRKLNDKQTGEEFEMISLPSYKADNGKYYNHVFFPITNELKSAIINKVTSLL